MAGRKREGALTKNEKRIVKALLNAKWRNQDIQALVNVGRAATINSARITEVKKNAVQKAGLRDGAPCRAATSVIAMWLLERPAPKKISI